MMRRMKHLVVVCTTAVRYCTGLTGPGPERPLQPVPTAVCLWGLVVGLALAGVFAITWKCFGDIYFTESTRLRLVPCVMVLLTCSIVNFRQLVGVAVIVDRLALNRPAHTRNATDVLTGISVVGVVAVVLAILLKFAILLAMPYHTPWWPSDWRRLFNPLYPRMHTRVLILLGLWGKTGLLIAAATGAQRPDLGPANRAFRQAMRVRALIVNLVIVAGITLIYFSSRQNRTLAVLVCLAVFLAVYLTSMLIAHRQRGHDQHSMFACAELGELALLLSYLAIAKYL